MVVTEVIRPLELEVLVSVLHLQRESDFSTENHEHLIEVFPFSDYGLWS